MATQPLPVRRPKLVLLAWLAVVFVTGFLIWVYPGIELSPGAKNLIRRDDPDIQFDAHAKEALADDELIVIAVESPTTVFDIPTLAYLDRLSGEIEKLPAVRKVYSLARADDIRGRGGMLATDDLMTEVPKTQDEVKRIEKEAFENPLYVNSIIAPDKKVAGINVELKAGHSVKVDKEVVESIYSSIKQLEPTKPPGLKTYVSGYPITSYFSSKYMIEDMFTFSIGSLILLTIIMYIVLRSWHGVAFTMFVAVASVNVTYAVMAVCGFQVTMTLSSMMAFMTAIGMEYSVYVAFAYQVAVQTGKQGRERRQALAEAILDVRFTVIMSASCATAAFLSVMTNPLHDLKVMGFFQGLGTLTCCFAALTIIPAWIAVFPIPVPTVEKSQHLWLQRLFDRIGRLDTRRPLLVLLALGVLAVVGVIYVSRMETNIDAFQYFRPSSTIRKDHEFVSKRMAGDAMLPLIIVADKLDTFKEPENLEKLAEIEQYALTLPHVTKAVSHADHIKLMNEALRSGTPADYKLPPTKAAVEQFLLLHNEPDDFHPWIDPDYKTACVMVRLDEMRSSLLTDTEAKLEAFTKQKFPTYDSRVVGTPLLVGRSIDEMASSLVEGTISASLLILLIMVIGFRSFRIGLMALIPTLPPALMVYATLPFIGHALDPPTSITGTIALGIAIDDTTWFISTWIVKRRQGADASTAVSQTLTAIGRPMILSSMVLGSGFLAMLFSRYLVLFWLGVMMAIVSFWSIFWDVWCTPTVTRLFDPKLPRKGFGA